MTYHYFYIPNARESVKRNDRCEFKIYRSNINATEKVCYLNNSDVPWPRKKETDSILNVTDTSLSDKLNIIKRKSRIM